MSTFAVPVIQLDSVLPHPNADRLELAQVGGYFAVVGKGEFKTGDFVVYVPEGSLVPQWLLDDHGLAGKLSGSGKNRVKAVKLRGALSQGLVLPLNLRELVTQIDVEHPTAQDDISGLLGITKYEPPVHASMLGQVGALYGYTVNYDIENIKNRTNLLRDDEDVILTEKLHGTCCQIGWCADLEPREDLFDDGRMFVTSKGLGKRGQFLKNAGENAFNLYIRTMEEAGLVGRLREYAKYVGVQRIWLFGEVFGDVQDLKYGHAQGRTSFRLFDVRVQLPGQPPFWVSAPELHRWSIDLELEPVPQVAFGRWSDIRTNLETYTRGQSLIEPSQIREGVVIRPSVERDEPRYGRVILKSVSEDYLLRKGNVTEME